MSYIESTILNDIIPEKENDSMISLYAYTIIMENGETVFWQGMAEDEGHGKGLAIEYAQEIHGCQVYDIEKTIPAGYIIRNDGMFGEWNLWLDDDFGTIIGNGYDSKDAAIQAAWQHKEINQSKGDVMNNADAIIIYASDAYGQYIPQYFAESIERDNVSGVSEEDYSILLDGPENELYWDVWNDVEDSARITEYGSGNVYTLHHDGDLFLVCDELMTHEQSREFYGTDVYGEDEDASVVFNIPEWIDDDVTLGQMQSISEGGCASGAYMPAVTYNTAKNTMHDHGDDVLQYIEDSLGEIPAPDSGESWAGIAVHYLSIAVELWAGQIDSIEIE